MTTAALILITLAALAKAGDRAARWHRERDTWSSQ